MAETTDKGAYGTRHVMEEEMRAAQQGVFEGKARRGAPKNKAEPAPANKSLAGKSEGDLIEIADEEGVKVNAGDSAATLRKKIEKARK